MTASDTIASRAKSTTSDSSDITITARRSESHDAPGIKALATAATDEVFGRAEVFNLIDKSLLSITIQDAEGDIIAAAVFADYPNVAGVSQATWLDSWYSGIHERGSMTEINTVFLHYFVSQPDYAPGALDETIRTMFNTLSHVHTCLLAVPRGCFPESALGDVFSEPALLSSDSKDPRTVIFRCCRADHVPVLFVRDARVEDHDDLTPMFNAQSDRLRETYGNYFLAELIEAEDESMKCIVVENAGYACGFMSVSTDVNYDLLNKCFELRPYNGLRKTHREDVVSQDQELQRTSRVASAAELPAVSPAGSPAKLDEETRVEGAEPEPEGVGHNDLVELPEEEAKADLLPGGSHTDAGVWVPSYAGPGNAVAIQLFCIDEKVEQRSSDLLSKVFSLFPDVDFVIISVPHLVPEYNLLQYFTRVPPRAHTSLQHDLYVFSKFALLDSFMVRPTSREDLAEIESLSKTLTHGNSLLQEVRKYNESRADDVGSQIFCFTALCADQVVGVCVISQEENIEYIRAHYNIESFVFFDHHSRSQHGHLRHFALDPIFHQLSRIFLKECLRQSVKTCLYYPVYPNYVMEEKGKEHSLVGLIPELVPVPARRQVLYNREELKQNAPVDRVLEPQAPYCLYHTNVKLCLEYKVAINAKIVVVGASEAGLAFLEALAFCPHLRFNNLTLVSRHGMPGDNAPPPEHIRNMLSWHGNYGDDELANISLRSAVNVVPGRMTALNRRRKFIIVNDVYLVPYDHLVLATGQQYYVPRPMDECPEDTKFTHEHRAEYIPENVFTLTDDRDCVALAEFRAAQANSHRIVVLFGDSLNVFTTARGLLACGLEPERLAILRGVTQKPRSVFGVSVVEDTMVERLQQLGVVLHHNMVLQNWTLNTESRLVEQATFASADGAKKITISEVETLVVLNERGVDKRTFLALNNACLVFDSRLVIDKHYHTNDLSIRATGPLTKWKRRYYADSDGPETWNSRELGGELAREMLKLFDPAAGPVTTPPADDKIVPSYTWPLVAAGVLPGELLFYHVQHAKHHKPGCRVLESGQCAGAGYFRLHVNEFSRIDAITCLRTIEKGGTLEDLAQFGQLYGLHEKYLNSLLSRWDEGLVTDLFTFFAEPWAHVIFHDRFKQLLSEIQQLMSTVPVKDQMTLEDRVKEKVGRDLQMSKFLKDSVWSDYTSSGLKEQVESRFLNYLSYNFYHLPMYARPGMV